MNKEREIEVYIGASVFNHHDPKLRKEGGWAYKLIYEDGHEEKQAGLTLDNTNYQMEMIAILQSLKTITNKSMIVKGYSNSENVIKVFNEEYHEHVNRELWNILRQEKALFKDVTFEHVAIIENNEHLVEVQKMAQEQVEKAKGITN